MVPSAERDSELVTYLAAQRARLSESKMVGVRGLAAAHEARLLGDIAKVLPVAIAPWCRDCQHAFIDADAELAQTVLLMDDNVDRLNEGAFFSLSSLMKSQPELTPQALNAMMIARSLERVADHATNVAEDVIFWVRGADVRHHARHAGDSSTPAAD